MTLWTFFLSLEYPGQSSSDNPTRTDPLGTELQYPEILPCIKSGRIFFPSFRDSCKALKTALMLPGSVHVRLSNVKYQILQQLSHNPTCVWPW